MSNSRAKGLKYEEIRLNEIILKKVFYILVFWEELAFFNDTVFV